MNNIGNYTVIYGNMIYTVENVKYNARDDRRVFYKQDINGTYDKFVLSLPSKGTVVIRNGEGVSMKVEKDIKSPDIVENTIVKKVVNNNDSDEVGAFVAGTVVGAILF